jgi:hypothetical protein
MKTSIYSPFRPKWKPENRTLSPSERLHLWKLNPEASSGTQKSSGSIGIKRSLGRRSEALRIAMELTDLGKKPHNLSGIVAKRMNLTPGTTRKYLGSFIADLKEARDSDRTTA